MDFIWALPIMFFAGAVFDYSVGFLVARSRRYLWTCAACQRTQTGLVCQICGYRPYGYHYR